MGGRASALVSGESLLWTFRQIEVKCVDGPRGAPTFGVRSPDERCFPGESRQTGRPPTTLAPTAFANLLSRVQMPFRTADGHEAQTGNGHVVGTCSAIHRACSAVHRACSAIYRGSSAIDRGSDSARTSQHRYQTYPGERHALQLDVEPRPNHRSTALDRTTLDDEGGLLKFYPLMFLHDLDCDRLILVFTWNNFFP